ncbi:MAG TPA: gamma-type small acid-soluble spore protein [Ureibacillus sp.]|nr:gamma-type small acid-soluble spore protein [Ureibacillus sp.]
MQNKFTASGTDIEEVKRKNAASGLSYKEVMEQLAKTGGKNTKIFSDTNIDEVKREIHHPN